MPLSLRAFVDDVRAGRRPPEQAQRQSLEAIRRHNGRLHALREWRDEVRQPESGPLCGVTVSAKDNIGVDGMQTWAGSPQALPVRFARSGSFVRRLASLGAVVNSKSHCAEFALGGSGYNPGQGTPINPFSGAVARVPGGSSSGTAVAVASGMAMLGIGTDTGGSVRVPAALCGCVGYRASLQHWPMDGVVPLLPRSDALGLIARDIEDLCAAVDAIDAPTPTTPLRGARVSLWPEARLEDCDADRRAGLQRAADALADADCELHTAGCDAIARATDLLEDGPNSAAIAFARFLSAELPAWRDRLNPEVAAMVRSHQRIDDDTLTARNAAFTRLAEEHREALFAGADFVLSPSTPIGAPAVAALADAAGYERYSNALLAYTVVGSVYQCCGISLPAGLDGGGLPMGLQLLGRPGDDRRLLALARALCRQLPDCFTPCQAPLETPNIAP